MYHFVALLWSAADSHASANARRLRDRMAQRSSTWICLVDADGLAVFHTRPRVRIWTTYMLANGAGVILGRLFPMSISEWHSKWTPDFDERASLDLVRTGGQRLVEGYWGSYVAFLRKDGNCQYVIRDCSGMVPCYRTRNQGVEIVFSDVADVAHLALPSFSINAQYLAAFIYSSALQIRQCGLNGVSEVLAGERLEVHEGRARQFSIWDPGQFCKERTIDDHAEAVRKLKDSAQYCIDAWGSTCDRILLRLSGGLDSAVVLGCLKNSPTAPAITCINRYSERPGEDERQYARLAVSHARVDLIEQLWTTGQNRYDSNLLVTPRGAKPTIFAALITAEEIELRNQIATRLNADSVWTGQGGDHLFYQMSTALGAADYVTHYGSKSIPGLLSAVADAARFSGQPYWSVFRNAWRLGRSQAPWQSDLLPDPAACFVSRDALPDHPQEYVAHPWMADSDVAGVPKGKQLQIRLLAEVLNRHRPDPRLEYAPEHHPLLSQPLVELCLQIPTYLLLRGGKHRALAREAFQDRVPAEIIARERKGTTTSSTVESIRRSEQFIRELLLDGVLARERIISRAALQPYFDGQPLRVEHLFPLCACIAAEVWARAWASTTPSLEPVTPRAHNDNLATALSVFN